MPLVIAGATSGSTTVQATDAVTATITLPSATGTVQLSGAAASFTTLNVGSASGGGVLSVKGGTNANFNINSSGTGVQLYAVNDANNSAVDFTYNGLTHIFVASSVTAMTLNTSGGIKTLNTISVGNATPSTSGAGITFPATQSASTDANTLDDYEEGTWTPVIGGDGGATGQTYTVQKGIYTKIGRNVTISGYITLTNKGTFSGITYTCITGLPFTGLAYDYAVNINYYLNLGGNIVQCTGYIASSGLTIYLCANTAASANLQATGFPQSYITNSTTIEFTATYFTA
jgi:hypothetical protein